MQIKFVEIHNMLSIGKVRLEFKNNGLTLLDGWNHDDSSANGAGKSAIPNSIAYGLYDKIPRKISKSEILRRGSKKGHVHIGVQVGLDLIEVKRCRPKNTTYIVNGIVEDMTQEEFENKIKMSYAQFLVCMYAAQTDGKRFLSLNDTEMKDFILKLMDLDRFLIKKKEIDAKIKELDQSKIDIEKLIVSCESKKSVYEDQLVDMDEILKKIADLDTSILERKYHELSVIKKPDVTKYSQLKQKTKNKLTELDKIDQALQSDRLIFSHLQREIEQLESYSFDDAIECPSCNERFISSNMGAIKIGQLRKEHDEKIKLKKAELQDVVSRINSAPNTRARRDEIIELSNKILEKERQDQQAYYDTMTRMSDIKSKINMNSSTIASLSATLNKQKEFQEKLAEISGLIDKANNKLNKIKDEIRVSSIISSILSPTGAPAYIVDSIVDIFNEKVSDYVSHIWPNAAYELQSFKENKSGTVRAKFSDKLVIAGRNVSIGSLSGGEFRCLSLSVDFAIIDVVESIFGFHVSPVFLDEPFEGLDQSNRERAVDLLEKLSSDRQIWIIDHASEAKSMFSDVVRIEKKNGLSDIIVT